MELVKGARLRKVTNFFQNDNFAVYMIGHITEILHYFSQNEGVTLKKDSRIS